MTGSAGGRTAAIATPEGVALELRLADPGERAMAFALDAALVLATIALLGLSGGWATSGLPGRGFLIALTLVAIFLVQSFYFVIFELGWQGATPGKRWRRVRVISRDGGPLTAGMVFARNITRQVELAIPLVVLLRPRALAPHAPGWAGLAALVWALFLLFFPFLNRYRARLGDLAAGTLVVAEPEAELEPDLTGFAGQEPAGGIRFTREQLEIYGNKELQVLEQVLRSEPRPDVDELLHTVMRKIQHKIGWEPPEEMDLPLAPRRFLVAFYTAQRARLEHEMLLGRPRQEKRG